MATIRTVADLLYLFRDGQAPKSVTSSQFQDLIASLHPETGNFVDLPTTAAGLAAGRLYLNGDTLQISTGDIPGLVTARYTGAAAASLSASARARRSVRAVLGGAGGLVATASTGALFFDDFTTLSLANQFTPSAGTWYPVAYWAPNNGGGVTGQTWMLNPFNPATLLGGDFTTEFTDEFDAGCYSVGTSLLNLHIHPTPTAYLSACGAAPYLGAMVVAPSAAGPWGRFEARMAVPSINGTLSSFYLVSNDGAGKTTEVNLEIVLGSGWSQNQYQFAVLNAYDTTPTTAGSWNNTIDLGTGLHGIDTRQMHVYTFDMRADYVTCLIDGVQCLRVATPAGFGANPWDIYLQHGSGGSWTGNFDANPTFTPMLIDWVRVTS